MADSDPIMEDPFSAIPSGQPSQFSHHGKFQQDIHEIIADMKSEYEDSGYPLTDDSQALQKFCAKLEYFFQVGQKSKTGLLGGKKDYWNFILDCLAGNKSLNDGVRFVKSISELKTNLGKGRALIRFALIHQRLADTLQQCSLNARTISDWYQPKAMWLNKNLVSDLINALYDLNDLQFDLSPRGYDLDTSWPTFARRTFGTPQSWKPPSRTTSITSLSSIPPLEVYLQASPSPSPHSGIDPEVLRLQHNLTTAELKQQEVSQQLDTIENEKMAAEISVEELNKKVAATEQQLKEKEKQCADLQVQNEKLSNELKHKEDLWTEKEASMKTNISNAEKKLEESAAENLSNVSFDSLEMAGQLLASQKVNQALQMELKNAELKVGSTERVDVQKSRLIELLDKKVDQLQGRNDKLTSMVEQAIADKEHLAKKLKEATFNITDMASRLSDSEKLNKELRVSNKAFKDMLHSMEEKGSKIAKVAKEKLVQYSEENKSLKAEIASKGEEAASVSSEIKKTEELSTVSSQLEAINKKLAGLEGLSNEGQESEVMQALKTSTSLNLEIRAQVEKLQGDLKAKEGLIEQERSELKTRICSLEGERDELKQALAGKSEGGSSLCVDPNSLRRVLEEKKKVLVNAQAEASRLREALAAKIAAKESHDKAAEAKAAEAKDVEGGAKGTEGGSADEDAGTLSLKALEALVYSISSTLEDGFSDQTIETEVQEMIASYESMSLGLADCQSELMLAMLKNAELMTLISKSESSSADLEVKVETLKEEIKEKEKEIVVVTSQCTEMDTKVKYLEQNAILTEEKWKEKEAQIFELSTSLANLKDSLTAITTEKEMHIEEINQLKMQLEESSGHIVKCSQEIAELEEQYKSKEQENLQLNHIKDNLVKETERMEKEAITLKENAAELEKSFNFSAEEKLNLLQKKLSSEMEAKQNLEKEIDTMKLSYTKCEKEINDKYENTTAQKIQLETDILEIRHDLDLVIVERDSLCKNVETMVQEKQELESQLVSKNEEVQTIQHLLESESKAKCDTNSKLKELQSDFSSLENIVQDLQSINSVLESEKEKMEELVTQLQQERNDFQTSSKEKAAQLIVIMENIKCKEQELCNAQERLTFMEESTNKIQLQFDENQAELNDLKQKLQAVENEKSFIEETLVKSESEVEQQVSEMDHKVQSLDNENILLREQVEKLLSEKDQMCQNLTGEKSVLHDNLELLKGELDQKSQCLTDVESKHNITTTELSDCRGELKEKSEVLDSLKEDFEKMKEEFGDMLIDKDKELENVKQQKEAEISSLKEDFIIMKEGLERRGNLWDEERSSLDQELSALKFQLSTEQMEYENKLKCYEDKHADLASMRDRISQQEALIETLEVELRALQTEREEEREHNWDEMKELQTKLSAKEDEFMLLCETSEAMKSSLGEHQTINKKLKATLVEEQKKVTVLQKESQLTINNLESDNMQLKKKLIQLVREKDTLWQKTDKLEYEQKLRASDTWMDGNSVTSCLACKTDFSLMRRKHHCRMCGKIFCWECCNNWVMTAHSSKKERVCNRCNLEMSQLSTTSDGGDDTEDNEPDIYASVEIPVKRSRKWTESDLLSSTPVEEDEELEVGSANLAAIATAAIASVSIKEDDHGPSDSEQDIYKDAKSESCEIDSDLQQSFATDEERLLSMTDDTKTEQASGQSTKEDVDDEVYDFITEDEIANSIMQPIPDPNMTFLGTLSSVDLLSKPVEAVPELWIRAGKSLAIPVHVSSVGVMICWQFTTQPKPIHFSVVYKEDEFVFHDDNEELIPPTKCNSHKETISGELFARKLGIYTLVFDNGPSRFTSKKLMYTLSAKIPASVEENIY